MIQSPKIFYIGKINNSNNYSKINVASTYTPTVNFGLKMASPLSCDTVSFSGDARHSAISLSNRVVNKLNIESRKVADNLVRDLESVLLKRNKNSDGSIFRIYGRGKSSKSIREKMVSDGVIKQDTVYNSKENWLKKEGLKSAMTDMVGARIVMNNSSKEAIDSVFDDLITFIKENNIKIIQIENKYPRSGIKDGYVREGSLLNLKEAAEEISNRPVELISEAHPVNYTAVHLLLKLPNKAKYGKNRICELQIMGRALESFKEVEDCCYKVKDGKHLKPMFKPVENVLKILTDNEKNADLITAFKEYTRAAYLKQLDKEKYVSKKLQHGKKFSTAQKNKIDGDYQKYLTIDKFIETSNDLSVNFAELKKHPELDFNNLANLIDSCKARVQNSKKIATNSARIA